MHLTRMIAAAAALSFVALSPTGAAAKHKRYKAPPVVAYHQIAPYGAGTARPPWAQPWECFTDEGYGRYRSCSSGRR